MIIPTFLRIKSMEEKVQTEFDDGLLLLNPKKQTE